MIRNDGQRLVEKPPTPGLRFEDLHLRDPEGGRLGVGLQTFAADDDGGSRTLGRQNIRSYNARHFKFKWPFARLNFLILSVNIKDVLTQAAQLGIQEKLVMVHL